MIGGGAQYLELEGVAIDKEAAPRDEATAPRLNDLVPRDEAASPDRHVEVEGGLSLVHPDRVPREARVDPPDQPLRHVARGRDDEHVVDEAGHGSVRRGRSFSGVCF